MSEFVSKHCACGVDIVSISPDTDDVAIAIATHNDLSRHREWHAVQVLQRKRPGPAGPCICKGGEAGPLKFRPKRGAA